MSPVAFVAVVAVVTVGSRVVSLALLPPADGVLAGLVERLPAPLFAALAAFSLLGTAAGPTDPALLAGVACAVVAGRWRSLLLALAAGLGGYLAVGFVL